MQQIPDKFTERAKQLAAESSRTADEILEQALDSGFEVWERQFRSLQRGVDQAHRGEFVSDEQITTLRNKYRPEA